MIVKSHKDPDYTYAHDQLFMHLPFADFYEKQFYEEQYYSKQKYINHNISDFSRQYVNFLPREGQAIKD